MRLRLPAVALVALLLVGCTSENGAMTTNAVLADSEVAPFLEGIGNAEPGTVETARLAEGLLPPTNRWYSGLVFGAEPQPVFPLPMSFQLDATGFAIGVPVPTASANVVAAPANPQLRVELGADAFEVSRYDDVSVTLSALRDGNEIATVTVARGSPLVSIVASSELELGFSSPASQDAPGVYEIAGGFAAIAPEATQGEGGIQLSSGDFANVVAVPEGTSAASLAPSASAPLVAVSTAWQGTTTTLSYETSDGSRTLIAALEHQRGNTQCELGGYDTILGRQQLCSASSLSWSSDAVEPSATLELSSLDGSARAELTDQVGKDLATTRELPADSYFGGKALARLANLLQLARELGDDAASRTAKQRLSDELLAWQTGEDCTTRCFVYDSTIGGIVGIPASFGSDEFNDHHFHYGYFLYAAAVAAAGDAELTEKLRPVMTLLAADIASGDTTKHFPARRVFDPYSGHSWASGFAPFADGNNQESSSEAVAAWNGLALWAEAVGDSALGDEARWMLAAEVDAAKRFYLDPSTYAGYQREVVGILWDGKVEYGTWFSADPGAILGIQLLPMQPVANYLRLDPERIRAQVAEARQGSLFADYVLMYEALAGDDVLETARALPASSIDDGNSRSYLLAWVMAH